MGEVLPWARLLAIIAPHDPKSERGRPPIGLERMLRVYFLQQWYGLDELRTKPEESELTADHPDEDGWIGSEFDPFQSEKSVISEDPRGKLLASRTRHLTKPHATHNFILARGAHSAGQQNVLVSASRRHLRTSSARRRG